MELRESRNSLAWVLLVAFIAVLPFLSGTVLAGGGTTTLTVTIRATSKGVFGSLNEIQTKYPITVDFVLTSNQTITSYFWNFGDGTNSSQAQPSHSYDGPCLYDVSVRVTTSNGTTSTGLIALGLFSETGFGHSIAVCPAQGTVGFTPVDLTGGYFGPGTNVNIKMNGTSITNVTVDSEGHFVFPLNSSLPPVVNGTKFDFTTDPPSVTQVFTALEGIRGNPGKGLSGASVTVEGRSYPPNTQVGIYLGGVYIGTGSTDGSGSFSASATLPLSAPLTTTGKYSYETTPLVLGSKANFAVTGTSLSQTFSEWWWLWLLLIVVIVILVVWWYRRRRRRLAALTGPFPTAAAFNPLQAINTKFDRVRDEPCGSPSGSPAGGGRSTSLSA